MDMKKLVIALPLLLTACKIGSEPNLAEVMVKAQAPKATCKIAKAGLDVAICDVPTKDKVVPFVAVYGKDTGFKVYPLVNEAPAQEAAPAPTPDAGTGSGSAK